MSEELRFRRRNSVAGADDVEPELKKRVKEYCQLSDTCPHISYLECAECIRCYINYFPRH